MCCGTLADLFLNGCGFFGDTINGAYSVDLHAAHLMRRCKKFGRKYICLFFRVHFVRDM